MKPRKVNGERMPELLPVPRPKKQFRVVVPYGPYRTGDLIEPTGVYRSALLAKGVIEPMEE